LAAPENPDESLGDTIFPMTSESYLNAPEFESLWLTPYSLANVHVHTTPGSSEKFIQECLKNAKNSILEPGIARFDVLQNKDNPSKFLLMEMYRNEEGPAEHKKTEHYNSWRDSVADLMAEPRKAHKFRPIYPPPDYWKTDAKAAEVESSAILSTKPLLIETIEYKVRPFLEENSLIGLLMGVAELTLARDTGVGRMDVLQSEDDQSTILFIAAYNTPQDRENFFNSVLWEESWDECKFWVEKQTSTLYQSIFPTPEFMEWPPELREGDLGWEIFGQYDYDPGQYWLTNPVFEDPGNLFPTTD